MEPNDRLPTETFAYLAHTHDDGDCRVCGNYICKGEYGAFDAFCCGWPVHVLCVKGTDKKCSACIEPLNPAVFQYKSIKVCFLCLELTGPPSERVVSCCQRSACVGCLDELKSIEQVVEVGYVCVCGERLTYQHEEHVEP